MKNNFSNFVKIICIIIGIVLVVWLVFALITRNDYSSNHQSSPQVEEDEFISVVESELVTIFSYINNTKESENLACQTLGTNLEYSVTSNDNFFDYYGPLIMDCLYDKKYPVILYNTDLNYKIISEEEWNTYENYFVNLSELNSIKDIYTVDILNNYTEEDLNNIDYYIDANYKIAYPILNNPIKNNITYKVDRIFKKGNCYIAKIIANINDKTYHGDLKINIVDEHCKYEPLIFY